MNTNDKLLWNKIRRILGKRKKVSLQLKDKDWELFIKNWEENVFNK